MSLLEKNKQRVAFICVVAAIGIASVTAWRVFGPAEPVTLHKWQARAHLSEEFNSAMVAYDQVIVRRQLSDEDAAFLLSLIGWQLESLPEPGRSYDLSPDEEEAIFAVGNGYAAAGDRLRHGGVSDEARERLAARVIAGLDSHNAHERLMAIQTACYGRLVADEAVRRRVVELQSDKNQTVASQAVRQLAHYDKIAELERTGRRPKEPPPAYWR